MHFRKLFTPVALAALTATFATSALAVEYPIGTPQQRYGMEIAAVYLQPVEMEPEGMMRPAKDSDLHMEADIHALANNPNGFDEGAWIPYLGVRYEVTKIGSTEKIGGDFKPMVANGGPHMATMSNSRGRASSTSNTSSLPRPPTPTPTSAATPIA